jgi:hypothetical protein
MKIKEIEDFRTTALALEARRSFLEMNRFVRDTEGCYFEEISFDVAKVEEDQYGPVILLEIRAKGADLAIFRYSMKTGRYDVESFLTNLLS